MRSRRTRTRSSSTAQIRTRQTVEPLANYSVLRARREFANQSSVGFMATATNRNLDDATRFLPGQAYTGGVDWDWRLGPRYTVQGYWAGSSVHGDAEAIDTLQRSNVHSFQRPDSTVLTYDPSRTSLNGYGASASLSKIGGQRVRFTTNVGDQEPGFEINDVGFLRRADQRTMSNWVQVRYDTPSKYLRSFRYNLNQWAGWNYDGDRLYSGINVNAHATFTNNWATGIGGNLNPQPFDDRGTRGGPGRYGNSQRSVWTLHRERRAPRRVGRLFLVQGVGRPGHDELRVRPVAVVSPVFIPEGQHRHPLQPEPRRIAVGRGDRRRALRVRAAAPADRRPHRAV